MKGKKKPVVVVEVYKGCAEVSENTGAEAIVLDWDTLKEREISATDIRVRMHEIRTYLPQNKNRKRILDSLQELLDTLVCDKCENDLSEDAGEGYGGLCGNCADKAELIFQKESRDEPAERTRERTSQRGIQIGH